MNLHLRQSPVNPDTEAGQDALADAHRNRERVECRCRIPAPEMYIAATAGKFIVKRMPGTGPDHAIGCASFLPPEELSGLAQVQATAITEDPDDGTTTLKLGFPMRRNGKAGPAPEMTGGKATEAKVAPRKLTITSVLHFLWHEAGLGKWYPAMEGKRYWGVLHSALRRAAAGKVVKGQDLSRILYVPEYFKADRKAEITARRNRIFTSLRPPGRGATPFGLVIAEYKDRRSSAQGEWFSFKHAPDCAFFAEQDLADRFEKVFGDQLRFLEATGNGQAILIGSFSVTKAGYPVLHEIGMMLVTESWIPFEGLRELDVLNALTEQKRAFQKQLRFNLLKDAPIASAVLLDTADPVALFVIDNPDDVTALSALTEAAEDGHYASWCWFDDNPMQAFPDRGPDRGMSPSTQNSLTENPEGDRDEPEAAAIKSIEESGPVVVARLPPRRQDETATERDAGQTGFGMSSDRQAASTSLPEQPQKDSKST